MRVVLLRPPRYVWPFNSETSAFWQPLGLLCLAAAARQQDAGIEIEIWDCPGERCGWRTLRGRLAERAVDVLGVGEETVSAHEALRAAAMVKELHPRCVVVAGGTYFAHAAEATLATGAVDAIVRGEGEETFAELLRHIENRSSWDGIGGITFLGPAGEVIVTPARPLIEDMDCLPFPAWDLLDMRRYGRRSRNHPDLASIEHSRGCIDSCAFCILWKQMGQCDGGNGTVVPRYRTKSAVRSFQEVVRLHRQFGRRTFGWVDPTFNASAAWSDAWSELVLRSQLMDGRGRAKTLHTAWVRADCVVRDHRLGVLGKLVRTGLRQVMIGVERDDDAGIEQLGKHGCGREVCAEAFAIFREHYPQVYTIGTMIFGLPGDTLADLKRLMQCEYRMGMDYGFLMPLTPNPGTAAAERAVAGGYVPARLAHIESDRNLPRATRPSGPKLHALPIGATGADSTVEECDLARYNFHTPVCMTDHLSLRDLESVYWRSLLNPSGRRLVRVVRQLLLERDWRKRRVNMALLSRGTSIAVRSLLRALRHPRGGKPTLYSRRPSWYDK